MKQRPASPVTTSSKSSSNTAPSAPSSSHQQLQQAQPLISKSGVLRILSELVRSYAGCAKIIAHHTYKASELSAMALAAGCTHISLPLVYASGSGDDCNALAFLLDNLLAANQTFGDKDCPSLCRLLIVAIASCNHCLDSQNALVHEVKLALARAVQLAESTDKYVRIQAFASIINTMIETCPPIQPSAAAQQPPFGRGGQVPQPPLNQVNNMMKIMHKKGLINELARVPLHMDLSCPRSIDTVNTILKPLETMSKTLNMSVRRTRADLLYAGHKPPTVTTPTTAARAARQQAAIAAATATTAAAPTTTTAAAATTATPATTTAATAITGSSASVASAVAQTAAAVSAAAEMLPQATAAPSPTTRWVC